MDSGMQRDDNNEENNGVVAVGPIQRLFFALRSYLLVPFLYGVAGSFGISVGMFYFYLVHPLYNYTLRLRSF